MNTSIIDAPRKAEEADTFGIDPFQKGLIEFTSHSATPITIALQGEWGSGKTSLMNTLERDLCSESGKYHGIWLNTWEYALMKDAPSALTGILKGLVKGIMGVLKQDETQITKIGKTLFSVIGKTAINVASAQLNNVASGAGDATRETLFSETEATIGSLRKELEEIIDLCIQQDTKKSGIVFFIDDLDRIDPPVAVQLLELLKNIFSIKNCIFILAIDYDVVIKGLEPKFGEFCEANEREFRSFFDKIIQLPFSMPVSSYSIDEFLSKNLIDINYLTEPQAAKKETMTFLTRAAGNTVGNNPRALKRLLNSLSLISCINRAKAPTPEDSENSDPELDLLVNFSLVSLQVAYPAVYRMIDKNPNFGEWDEQAAIEFNLKPLTEELVAQLAVNEEFDETWEQILFQACESDIHLRKKALSISRHLNELKALILSKGENVGEVTSSIISLSAVTSLEALDKPVIDYHRGQFAKNVRWHMIEQLKNRLPELKHVIQAQGKRVQTNAYLKLSEADWKDWFRINSHPHDGGIRLHIMTEFWVCPSKSNDEAETKLKALNLWNDFLGIRKDYEAVMDTCQETKPKFPSSQFGHVDKNHYCCNMGIFIDVPSPDNFYNSDIIKDEASSIVAEIHKIKVRLSELNNLINNSSI